MPSGNQVNPRIRNLITVDDGDESAGYCRPEPDKREPGQAGAATP